MKRLHEIRDPIHGFIRLDSGERRLLDSEPLQRLRYVHQLAMTYLVYPGATHRRFEHSLGVMELATRIYDAVTREERLMDEVRDQLPELNEYGRAYWRRVLRVAALCHDVGHLPFSHGAEAGLLPEGWRHEDLTREIILSKEFHNLCSDLKVCPLDVAKISVGPSKMINVSFTPWEELLSEIITGDAFGADRMDYLLRDSYHTGVAYGRFDHYRLLETLQILPWPYEDSRGEPPKKIALGVEEGGGIEGIEALLVARYLIYSQVYFHPIRRIYDIHLKEFMQQCLPDGQYPTAVKEHLKLTDDEILAAMRHAAEDPAMPGHEPARIIMRRQHFQLVFAMRAGDRAFHPEVGLKVAAALEERFGQGLFRRDAVVQQGEVRNLPVLRRNGQLAWSYNLSPLLQQLPGIAADYVFADRSVAEAAKQWIEQHRPWSLPEEGGAS